MHLASPQYIFSRYVLLSRYQVVSVHSEPLVHRVNSIRRRCGAGRRVKDGMDMRLRLSLEPPVEFESFSSRKERYEQAVRKRRITE